MRIYPIAFEFIIWNFVPCQYFRSARGVIIWKLSALLA